MAILAYDKNGYIVGRWSKDGARYVHHIEYLKGNRQISFVGQANLAVVFRLADLKVTGSTRFG